MKRAFLVMTVLLAVTAGLPKVCIADEAGILPGRIENLTNTDEIPEGSEPGESADPAYHPRMLVGVWKRTKLTGKAETIEVPAPDGSGDTWTVECLPDQFIFASVQRGDADGEKLQSLRLDDYYDFQGRYSRTDAAGKTSTETVSFRNVTGISGSTLAVGFTGEAADEAYLSEEVTAVDITEVDYQLWFEGCELTLSYGGAEAVYVPATCPDGDLVKALDGFDGSCDYVKHPDWHFNNLVMKGDGTGTANTLYGAVEMTVETGRDGSITFKTDHDETFTYDAYWYSDSCLTLGAGEDRLMYQDNYVNMESGIAYCRNYIQYPFFNGYGILKVGNKNLGDPLCAKVSMLSDAGGRSGADLEGTMVPSGGLTEPFEVTFKGSTITVRAMNPTDMEMSLKDCIVVMYSFDSEGGNIFRRTHFFDDSIGFACGETKESLLARYDSFVETNENTLCATVTDGNHYSAYDFSDYGADLLFEGDQLELLVLNFTDGKLTGVTSCSPSLLYQDLEYQVPVAELLTLDRDDAEETAAVRSALADALAGAVLPGNVVRGDEGCAVCIPRADLFDYGSFELSEAGKKLLDETAEALIAAVPDPNAIAGVEAAAYFRFETADRAFSKLYADAIAKYLSGKKNGLTSAARKFLKGKVQTGAYASTNFLTDPSVDGYTHLELRFILKPVHREEKVYTDTKVTRPEAEDTTGAHAFMEMSEQAVGRKIAAFATRYAGTYAGQAYTNEALGIRWNLPEQWYIYDDTALLRYNGRSAQSLLLADKPVYIFAATDDEDMVDIRLHPFEIGSDYADRAEEYARSLFTGYEAVCRVSYDAVETKFEEMTWIGNKVWTGTFTFKTDGRTICRKQYYYVREDAVAVISVTSEGSARDLTSLGF